MALTDMHAANPGQLFAVRRLCETHDLPFDVMSKTMQRLARGRILRSVKGVTGGYQIARDLATVTLLDLMEAVLGSVALVTCLKGDRDCHLEGHCNVSSAMTALDRKMKAVYRQTTVLELIEVALEQRAAKAR